MCVCVCVCVSVCALMCKCIIFYNDRCSYSVKVSAYIPRDIKYNTISLAAC